MKLFGYNISRDQNKLEKEKLTFSSEETNDGTVEVETSGGGYATLNKYILNLESEFVDERARVNTYRKAAKHPDIAIAIDEIVNDAIVNEDHETISLSLDDSDLSESIKKKIRDEFDHILKLLDFNVDGSDIFKRWYIDGKIFYHKVTTVNKQTNKSEGIVELRYLDPRRIKKVREVIKDQQGNNTTKIREYYVYTLKEINKAKTNTLVPTSDVKAVEIEPDMIAMAHSGLSNNDNYHIESYLDKALKPLNQLTNLEDSVVVYRVARAPERRVFYIGVGNLPKTRAEQYMKSIIDKYKNNVVYDSNTGAFTNNNNQISMMEDFWLPRREDGRTTQIDTLPSASNLGEMEDVNYFKNRLFKALHLPLSRFGDENNTMGLGRSSEITRDELKFTKFINKLQRQFSALLYNILKTQLILKGILTEDDWETHRSFILFEFTADSFYTELKNAEIMTERLTLLDSINEHVGKYFSIEYVQRNILMMDDDDIDEMKKQIEEEAKEQLEKEEAGLAEPEEDDDGEFQDDEVEEKPAPTKQEPKPPIDNKNKEKPNDQ